MYACVLGWVGRVRQEGAGNEWLLTFLPSGLVASRSGEAFLMANVVIARGGIFPLQSVSGDDTHVLFFNDL